jgi:predicted DNA-binding transcriptional regulator YafY
MVYQSASQAQAESRRLDPYALAYRWGWWYVAGFCHLRQELRTFRLDRIQSLALLEDTYQIPADFDAKTYFDREFQGGPQLRVRMRFSAEAAHIALANRSSWEAVEEQADGSVIVDLSAPDVNWAASLALAYGPLVTVLEPEEVRRTVRDWAQATAGLYDA